MRQKVHFITFKLLLTAVWLTCSTTIVTSWDRFPSHKMEQWQKTYLKKIQGSQNNISESVKYETNNDLSRFHNDQIDQKDANRH